MAGRPAEHRAGEAAAAALGTGGRGAVGIEVATGEVFAPDGFDELRRGLLRPNPAHLCPEQFAAKAGHYRARWPWLTILQQ